MRKLFFPALAALALALPACTPGSIGAVPASPSAVCDRTGWDERAGTAIELGYKLFRTAGELGVDLGRIKGATATRIRALDNQLFAATQAAQSAYATCNAASYSAAIAEATRLLAEANAALPK